MSHCLIFVKVNIYVYSLFCTTIRTFCKLYSATISKYLSTKYVYLLHGCMDSSLLKRQAPCPYVAQLLELIVQSKTDMNSPVTRFKYADLQAPGKEVVDGLVKCLKDHRMVVVSDVPQVRELREKQYAFWPLIKDREPSSKDAGFTCGFRKYPTSLNQWYNFYREARFAEDDRQVFKGGKIYSAITKWPNR